MAKETQEMDSRTKKLFETVEHVVYYLSNTIDEIGAIQNYISKNFENDWNKSAPFNRPDFENVLEPVADEINHALSNLAQAVRILGVLPTQDNIDEILSAFKE